MSGIERRVQILGNLLLILAVMGIALGTSYRARMPFGFPSPNMTGWAKSGTAFGRTALIDTFDYRQKIPGLGNFEGRYLVGSVFGGNQSIGELLSPTFRLDANFLTFMVGGGEFPKKCEVVLIVGGEFVYRETGNGSNALKHVKWDITDHRGKMAKLAIRDYSTAKGGYILADDFMLQNS